MTQQIIIRCTLICTVLAFTACGETIDSGRNTTQDETTQTSEGDEQMNQTEQNRRIDYIEFQTTNIDDTKKFYSEVFGWEFTDYGPEYTSFNDGRLAGGFTVAPEVSSGSPLVVIYSINLEETVEHVSANGGKIVREIFEFPGGRRFHFNDPSGNELAVWSDK